MANPRFVPLHTRGLVRVTGPDADALLQGLFSVDLSRVTSSQARYGALLSPQGKFLFDFFLTRFGEALLLDTEMERVAALIQRLTLYRLRAKAQFEDVSENYTVTALLDPTPWLGADNSPGAAQPLDNGALYLDPRHTEIGARLLLPPDEMAAFITSHHLDEAPFETYERQRLRLALPDGGRDMTVDKAILLENGFEELHGVDFDKGCFVGQELTARTKHRALIKKRLLPIRFDGPAPNPGTPIMAGDREAGELRSGVDGLALALLRLNAVRSEAPLSVEGLPVRVEPPEWFDQDATAAAS